MKKNVSTFSEFRRPFIVALLAYGLCLFVYSLVEFYFSDSKSYLELESRLYKHSVAISFIIGHEIPGDSQSRELVTKQVSKFSDANHLRSSFYAVWDGKGILAPIITTFGPGVSEKDECRRICEPSTDIFQALRSGQVARTFGHDQMGRFMMLYVPLYQLNGKHHIFGASIYYSFYKYGYFHIAGKIYLYGILFLVFFLPFYIFIFKRLSEIIQSRKQDADELRKLSCIDYMTNLPNRRAFIDSAKRELSRALRHKHNIVFFMADIDHFKRVNDTYGHIAGDKVLESFAKLIRDNFRTEDLFGRYGGEEFVMLLPDVDKETALKIAERLRLRTEQTSIVLDSEQIIRITISLGIVIIPPDCITTDYSAEDQLNEMLSFADKAMYQAKKLGRNQVCVYDEDMSTAQIVDKLLSF